MIYEVLAESEPIRQGDIFAKVPRLEIDLDGCVILEGDDLVDCEWEDIASGDGEVSGVVGVRFVTAVVISQDCDASRAPDIALCEMDPFSDVERKAQNTSSPKKWMKIITQHSRLNLKWFYLPPAPSLGIPEKMAADFRVPLRVPREYLDQRRYLRLCRLNDVALAHFRERVAEFFRRYAYDEWYPLSKDELEAYRKDHQDAEPFPWQALSVDEAADQ